MVFENIVKKKEGSKEKPRTEGDRGGERRQKKKPTRT